MVGLLAIGNSDFSRSADSNGEVLDAVQASRKSLSKRLRGMEASPKGAFLSPLNKAARAYGLGRRSFGRFAWVPQGV
jgi:hypothetical protein